MNVDKLFNIPSSSIPSGKNKRKLTANPNIEVLKAVRQKTNPEELEETSDFVTGNTNFKSPQPVPSKSVLATSSSLKGKGKAVQISDEVEEQEYYIDDYDEYESGAEEEEGGRFYGGGLTEEQKRILDLVDQFDIEEQENLDLAGVRKMIQKFEKAINKNQELRVKYPDDPTKFMESEADLDEEIKHLLTLTEVPDLYPHIVQLGAVSSIVSLLSHENTDITIDAIELMNELTDEDVVAEHEEDAIKTFIDALLENQVLELLVQNLGRLDEEETTDKQGVFNTLGIIENLTSFDPAISERVVRDTNLLQWILNRIRVKAFDSNKQYCSELLAILLQNSRVNRLKLGEFGGVDVLLQVLNSYKRKDPKDADETEMMENYFDALCLVLEEPEIKQKFLEGEGVELMLIMMKEKMMSRMRAIKVLDHALSTPIGLRNCERFVEIFGLKTLFSAFMRKGLKKLKKNYKAFAEFEEEEHIMGIIVSLLKNLPLDSEDRMRLINKFIENNYEKVDRLLEMRESYEAKVESVNKEIEEEKETLEGDDSEMEELYLRRRLDGGLFTLQLVDLTIAWICYEDSAIKEHVSVLLNRTGHSLSDVKTVLEEYYKNMGDVDQIEAENRDSGENIEDSMDIDNELSVVTKTDDTLKEGLLKEKQIVEMLIGSL
ncbi:Catenin-beta-like protein [Glomus cerebriforme]|uniref:Catenin-beta-like protein n=1 Tax=Glomus cerebriforme TaxID=658196 RepID=A0A397SZ07_9GLOM|nr:Catenin-beta-like protein [Glomus cerebriforme]